MPVLSGFQAKGLSMLLGFSGKVSATGRKATNACNMLT
jgi:hypothetical protein